MFGLTIKNTEAENTNATNEKEAKKSKGGEQTTREKDLSKTRNHDNHEAKSLYNCKFEKKSIHYLDIKILHRATECGLHRLRLEEGGWYIESLFCSLW